MTTEKVGDMYLVAQTPPDGTYNGHWGGYWATFSCDGINYHFRTVDGIRTPNAPAIIVIKQGRVTVRVRTDADPA